MNSSDMNLAVMHDSQTKRTAIRSAPAGVRRRDLLGAGLRNGRRGTMRGLNERRMGLVATSGGRTAATLGMLMVSAGAGAAAAGACVAQPGEMQPERAPAPAVKAAVVPYAVGEELTYKASLGGISAGTARMRVDGIEIVRGRPAYHVVFSLDGGIPFFRVHDRYESWI